MSDICAFCHKLPGVYPFYDGRSAGYVRLCRECFDEKRNGGL